MKRNKPRLKMTLIFAAFALCAAVLGILMLLRYEKRPAGAPAPSVPQQTGTVSVTLLFASSDGTGLVREGRNIEPCGDTAGCMAAVVEELASGPLGELAPSLPPNTVVREARLEKDQAIIDLEPGFLAGLPEGSSAEMTAVYSIVDSIAVNFPEVKAVRLLVDGKQVETLKGHLDLRQPLAPDFSLEKPAEK